MPGWRRRRQLGRCVAEAFCFFLRFKQRKKVKSEREGRDFFHFRRTTATKTNTWFARSFLLSRSFFFFSLSLLFGFKAPRTHACCVIMSASLVSRQSCACACSASGRSTSAPSIPSFSSPHRRQLSRGSPRSSRSSLVMASMQPGEIYVPDPLMDISAIRAAAGAPGAAAGAGGGGGRPRRRGPPDLPSLLMDGRIVYLGMPVRSSIVSWCRVSVCLKWNAEERTRIAKRR